MISKLQYITQETEGKTHWQMAEEACLSGVDWVQLRIKDKSDFDIKNIAIKTQNICIKYGAKFIINDHIDLAKKILADGVHLGKSDMELTDARKIVGDNFIIGGTANTFEDICKLVDAGVDYIGLGPFRFTETKKNLSPVLGIEGYHEILKKCRENNFLIPIVAIGGILPEDIPTLINTGIYGIAVSSGISFAKDKPNAINLYKKYLNVK